MTTSTAIDRFLASPALAESTRRAYASDLRGFADWLEPRGLAVDDVDVRVLVDYASELGRARQRARARRRSHASSRPSAPSSASRSARPACPTHR